MDKGRGKKLRRVSERLRKDGLMETLRYCLKRLGVEIRPFYYAKEALPAEIPENLTAVPESFEFLTFGRDEVMAISEMSEREGYVGKRYVIDHFEKGDTCLGLKKEGRIAAFSWFSLEETGALLYPAKLEQNEAYLFDMYVLQEFRGNNLAPILRYKNYEVLRDMGRDTFYSITECYNKPSRRFKEKLGAEFVFFGVYVRLFRKRVFRRVLKRY
jgi:GNAT superfamily N-acetyltransferase